MSEETIAARIPPELKRIVDAHPNTNKDIITKALWREFGGEDKSVVKHEIQEKKDEIAMLEQQIKDREERIQEKRQKLKALNAKLGEIKEEETEEEIHREELIQSLKSSEARENNANVIKVSRELEMEPSEVVDIMVERFDKERKGTDSRF